MLRMPKGLQTLSGREALFILGTMSLSAVLLLPAIIGLFSHADLSDRIDLRQALPHQNFNLPKLHDNLFGLGSLNRHSWFYAFLTIGADHFKGGGSISRR